MTGYLGIGLKLFKIKNSCRIGSSASRKMRNTADKLFKQICSIRRIAKLDEIELTLYVKKKLY